MAADFKNAHRAPKSKIVQPNDLIKLSFDNNETVAKRRDFDMDAVIKKYGRTLNGK